MAGRFPGSENLEQFWQNLRDGVECISFLSDEQLQAMAVPAAARGKANFVKASPILHGIDLFDGTFFGYSPREAELMDPQHRLFLECSWEALEAAGYDPEKFNGLIGVYAGTSLSSYLLYNVLPSLPEIHSQENLEAMIANDKDFLSTRVAYKLNLKGPALDVQTGCSTSLVAVHLACQSLLSYQCDMVLAGGVSVQVPQRTGYYYQEGGLNSPDGHCRAFDASAQGTLFGSGLGVVVLRRLADALNNGDFIHAVIRGSAINNDGSQKVGFTAPSVEGQTTVILSAQALAGVEADSISYVECHGTGTTLGDPVEVLALSNAFRTTTDCKNHCALGSVKTNIGHLDAAAGVAGLIKTVLALEHRLLPPSLNFQSANPNIDFANSPFYVNNKLTEWKSGSMPLRAGVSSFGIGGTNAHLILEEAPPPRISGPSRGFQLLLLSAKTNGALETATAKLLENLKQNPQSNLADVAYTLSMGRKSFGCRRAAVCSDVNDAVLTLEKLDPSRVFSFQHDLTSRPVVFMFPGGGAQYPGMGLDLYKSEPVFRDQIDLCSQLLTDLLGFDIRDFLYPSSEGLQDACSRSRETLIGLPALFITEYALARLWMSWGVVPQALIGHSLGEYTAATLAGVFSLRDALSLVVTRAALFEQLPAGAMIGVPLAAKEIQSQLGSHLSLAAVNGESQCVVSGPKDAIEDLIRRLGEQEVDCRRIQIDVAGHSQMVEPILAAFRRFLETIEFHPPQIPYISNVTGTWITAEEAIAPDYWVRHLRQPVLFGPGLRQLLLQPKQALLEVGPGHTLTTLAKLQASPGDVLTAQSSMRHPYDRQSDVKVLLTTLAKLWLCGVSVDWEAIYKDEHRNRLDLPTYPFERRRYWIEPSTSTAGEPVTLEKINDLTEWFYLPSWKRAMLPAGEAVDLHQSAETWLVFVDERGVGSYLAKRLACSNAHVVTVCKGPQFCRVSDGEYRLDPARSDQYSRLLQELKLAGEVPRNILHLWTIDGLQAGAKKSFDQWQRLGLYSLISLTKALVERGVERTSIWVVSTSLNRVENRDKVVPELTTLLAPCTIIPQEYEKISCRCLDIDLKSGGLQRAADHVLAEIQAGAGDKIVAYRGDYRWVRTFEPIKLGNRRNNKSPECLAEGGVYLITGGLGGIGLQLASHLAKLGRTKLALTGRSALPEKEQWGEWIENHAQNDSASRKILKLQSIEALGAELMVFAADVANRRQMQEVVHRTRERWGAIRGVIHAAGVTGEGSMHLIPELPEGECERNFQAKVHGLKVLEEVLQPVKPDFCVLFSSNASVLGGLGSIAYSAANLFMDAFAQARSTADNQRWLSVNWDGWLIEGAGKLYSSFETSIDRYAMTPPESWEAFRRIVSFAPRGQIVVSTGDLKQRMKLWISRDLAGSSEATETAIQPLHARPTLGTAYVPPSNELEGIVLGIWQQTLGIEHLGTHDNFFELGGNSLIGLKMIGALKKALRLEIPIMALFEGPTVKALCQVIEQKQGSAATFEESRTRGERRRMGSRSEAVAEHAYRYSTDPSD
jgi:acyl transferase domain-containing protein